MKQFKNLILAGALVLGLAGFAVSCDKYGDDIDSLQTQVDAIKADLQALQAKVDGGKYVTNVVKSGDGIVITWNDNSTSTIETIKGDKGDKGEDGKAGTVVTIVDGYWAFDGVKSEYPAVGPKGEDGVDGAPGKDGVDGHDAKVSEDGYWMVWDAEAGEYVKTEYIAGGVRAVETTGGYNLTVRDEDGVEQTIFVPTCPILVGIQDVKDRVRPLDIFYGVVNQAVDWDGAKGGAEKKMQAGMYPVLEEDVQVVLNPTGVDATAYRFDFRASDNKELWGLTFNDMVPYVGEKLLATRAVSSENGIWVLPREVARVELNELNARADYVTQFKKNDGSLYAFALNATSKTDASQVIKSQYIYSFDPKNIGVQGKDEPYVIKASDFDPNKGIRHNYVWNEYHTPDFKAWQPYNKAGSVYDVIGNVKLDQVIYDYKIEIDRTKMTQVNIDKYGLEISEDGYYFRTTKEASINNYVDLKISYILINGTKATKDYRVYITAKDLVVTDTNIGTINEPFNAVRTSNSNIPALNNRYVLGAKELAFNPKEVLGANYDEWVDAMFNKLYNVNLDKDKADSLKVGVSILGGDPINNDATYNDLLVRKFLYFDYVDASGKSCIYGVANDKVLSRLADIAALKVYFIAGTYDTDDGAIKPLNVKAPFYTIDGTKDWNYADNGFAIPLNNAFSVEVATSKEEYDVAAFTFKFQLTQPEIEKVGIVRKEGEFTTWTENKNSAGKKTADVLAVYGAYDDTEMRLPMYEAFDMWIGKAPAIYTKPNPNAQWFELTMATTPNTALFEDNTSNVYEGTLADIEYEVNWKDYETYMKADQFVPNDCPQVVVDVDYHFFGVYPALPAQLPFYTDANDDVHPGFQLQYTSTIAKSSMQTKEAVYNAKAGTHYVFISNDDIVAKTQKGREFVLFDGLDAKSNVTTRAKLNDARGFNEDIRPFDAPMDYEISAIRVGDKQPVTVKSTIIDKTAAGVMPWIVDKSTSSIEPDVPAPAADDEIQVYLFPSSKNYPVGDDDYPLGLPAVEGGFVIQLGQNIDYRQPIEVTIKVKDALGYSQNLKVVVQKLED